MFYRDVVGDGMGWVVFRVDDTRGEMEAGTIFVCLGGGGFTLLL